MTPPQSVPRPRRAVDLHVEKPFVGVGLPSAEGGPPEGFQARTWSAADHIALMPRASRASIASWPRPTASQRGQQAQSAASVAAPTLVTPRALIEDV